MYTAIRNNCLSFIEKKQKTVLGDFNGQEIIDMPGERPSPTAKEADYDTLLKEALTNLPPKCREVFVLSRVSNLTYKQIGDSLGISIKTVENQMGKALKILRAYIKQKQGIPAIISIFLMFLTS
jgi:RNA polymerase sigma-70 factor (ECF subfamily)